MTGPSTLLREIRSVTSLYPDISANALQTIKKLIQKTSLSVADGDIVYLNGNWYVRHAGLLRLAVRRNCTGIRTQLILASSDPVNSRWVFRATVFKSPQCKGFNGYGDANPSNVSTVVQGAELRMAETRAVNRALRKAYGIGICSVEEIGSANPPLAQRAKKVVEVLETTNDGNGHNNNGNGIRVRDRLCQVIRQHALDAELVKAYAIDFCGTKTLREASRDQVENFVAHLADWAEKDRNALLCQLNSYSRPQAGAA